MNTNQKLPSDTLKQPTSRRKVAAVVVATALTVALAYVGGSTWAARQANTAPAPRAVADAPLLSHAEVTESAQIAQDSQQAAADEKARQDLAAQQAAAAAAAQAAAAHHSSSAGGPIRCPAGSSANSNDGVNDTSCFPDICFHIPIPDPAHPECDTAFKP